MSGLPQGWYKSRLSDCSDVLDSLRVPVNSDERSKRQGNVPYYGATGQVGWIDNFLFDEELLLIGEDGAPFFDKTKQIAYLINGKSWVNNHAHVLKAKAEITSNRYLKWYLDWFDFHDYVNGTTRLKLTQGAMNSIPVLLPSLNEQRRIVAKLDELFSRVDACQQRLARIPVILKRFRQAVLAAACSGRLTADWREKQGIADGDDLPEGWKVTSLRDICFGFQYGTSSKSQKSGDVPVLRMGNLQSGKIDWTDLAYTSDKDEIKKYQLVKGDVLFNRTNSPELVGKTSIYLGEYPAIFAGYLIRVKNKPGLDSNYLNYCLNSSFAKEWCQQVKTDGVSQSNINAQKLAAFEIPLPPLPEQQEIVRRVEGLFKLADRLEARYTTAQAQVDKLTQSILAKAFRGELVPQDPNDEPAEKLLERIREGRSARPPRKREKEMK